MTFPSDPEQRAGDEPLQYSTGGGTVVTPRPSEQAYPLRREEFLTLCDGEAANTAQQWRNFCLAWLFSAVIGLAGLWGSVDLGQAIEAKRMTPVYWVLFLALMVLGSFCLTLFFHVCGKRQQGTGPYTRLKKRIEGSFGVTRESNAPHQSTDPSSPYMRDRLVIQSARYGADTRWKDVTDILRAKIRDGKLRVEVTNDELGPDPAEWVAKNLEVSYIFEGEEQSKSVAENGVFCVPDN